MKFATLASSSMQSLRVLVLCAMPQEYANFMHVLGKEVCASTVSHLTIGKSRVDCACTGIGMVNAAAATTRLIEQNKPDVIVNFGCAGAHDPKLKLGDVIVGSYACPFASIIIDKNDDVRHYGVRDNDRQIRYWKSDPTLRAIAVNSHHRLVSVGGYTPTIDNGIIASSDIWIDNTDVVNWVSDKIGSSCEEMEAAAIAQVATQESIPFVLIKDISNSVFNDMSTFDPIEHDVPTHAGLNSAIVAVDLCQTMADMLDDVQ